MIGMLHLLKTYKPKKQWNIDQEKWFLVEKTVNKNRNV